MKLERRFLSEPVAVEQVGDSKKIRGYAAKFNSRSSDMGGFKEEIDPKAFDRVLRDRQDCRALWNHDTNHVLGRVKAGTLELTKDAVGLQYSIAPPNTQVAKDLMASMERGDIDNASFAFTCLSDEWFVEKDGTVVRRLLDVDLWEISPTTFPAYPDATAQVRSLFPESEGKMPEEISTKVIETRAKQQSEKRYKAIRSAVAEMKWAILPSKLETIVAMLEDRAAGKEATQEEIRAALDMQHGDTPQATGVAVIPMYGTVAHRMGMFDDFSGGTSCESLTKQLRAALADESVSHIVFDIDSPGGTVTGVPELAAEIFASRGQKPIIAVANGMSASAAYWIASACDKIVVTPSGEVGSIGVYQLHQDVSALLDKEGVKMSFIQAGKYKTDGNPYEPLSDSAREDMQASVDKFYQMFTRGVAGGRGVSQEKVINDFGQGRMLLAEDALAAGMVDEIATLDDFIAGLLPKGDAVIGVDVSSLDNTYADTQSAAIKADEMDCACMCNSCMAGNCDDCTNDDCDDPNCGCDDFYDDDDEDDEDCDDEDCMKAKAETETLRLRLALLDAQSKV